MGEGTGDRDRHTDRSPAAILDRLDHPDHPEPEAVLRFLVQRAPQVGEITRLLRDIESEPQPSLDPVAVAIRAVRRAVG